MNYPLLEALRPFARLANPFDLEDDVVILKIAGTCLTAGDIRRAKLAYERGIADSGMPSSVVCHHGNHRVVGEHRG